MLLHHLTGVLWPSGLLHRICVHDGRVVRMWFPIVAVTVVLCVLHKTLYQNCYSPPRSKWVPSEGRVGCCVRLALYAPKWQQLSCILPREPRWFQE